MKDLSLHLLDIIQNSIQAGAKSIVLEIHADRVKKLLELNVIDDGKGMDDETLNNITSPFYTTRNTRRIGLGIPLFQASAERCDGALIINSHPGKGTAVKAVYRLDHIDRPPLGDVTETILAVITANPNLTVLFNFRYIEPDQISDFFRFDTTEVKQILKDVPLNHPDVLCWIAGCIRDGIKNFSEVLNYEVAG